MASEKGGLSFKAGMGRRLHLSVFAFVITFLLAVGITIFAFYQSGRKDSADVPQLALNTLLKNVLAYHASEGRFPKNLAALEFTIWNKKQGGYQSKLYGDPNMYLGGNYLYIYAGDEQVCALWAIPQGKFQSEANTVYLLIKPDKQEMWRGDALTADEVKTIPRQTQVAITDMARLGMFLQKQDAGNANQDKKTGKSPFGLK